MIENFLSPDVVKNNAVEESAAALRELNAQVVVETNITDTRNQVDTQTYDATADFKNPAKFSKSREISEVTPPLTQQEVEKIMKDAKTLLASLEGLDVSEMSAENAKKLLEGLEEMYDKVGQCFDWYEDFHSRSQDNLVRAKAGTTGISREISQKEIDYSQKKVDEATELLKRISAIITKIETHQSKKEINDAKANGVVTDYTKVAENPKLAEVIDKLHITFQKDEDGLIGVYVNDVYTNFDILDPEYDISYKIFSDSKNVGVIVEKEKKSGSVYRMKYILKGDEVHYFHRKGNKTEWIQGKNTFKIPTNENPAKKEVSMSH